MNRAQRRALGISGAIVETVDDALETTRRTLRGARGVQPATIANVEQVQILGGHRVLVTVDTPDDSYMLALEPTPELVAWAKRIVDLAGDARTGLFVVR